MIWHKYLKYRLDILRIKNEYWIPENIIISDLKRLNPQADPALKNWNKYWLYQFPMWDKFFESWSQKAYEDTGNLWRLMSSKANRKLNPLNPVDQIEAWVALIHYVQYLHQITSRQAATLIAKWLIDDKWWIDLNKLSDEDKRNIFLETDISSKWWNEKYWDVIKNLPEKRRKEILDKMADKLYWEKDVMYNPTDSAILGKAQWYLWVSEATWNNDWDPSRLFSQSRIEMWCANFVTTILYQNWVINEKTRNNWQTRSAAWLQKILGKNWFTEYRNPDLNNIKPWDIIFVNSKSSNSWRHVWIIDSVMFNWQIITIEWNRSNSVSKWKYTLNKLKNLNFAILRPSKKLLNRIDRKTWLPTKLVKKLDKWIDNVKDNISNYNNLINKYARHYWIDSSFIKWVIATESRWNPKAMSRQWAKWLMQFMPATWKQYWIKNAFDPEENIRAWCKYLSKLLKKFKWNYPIAATAFNTWPTRVERIMKANRITFKEISNAWPFDTKLLDIMIYWPKVKWFWRDWKRYYRTINYYKDRL